MPKIIIDAGHYGGYNSPKNYPTYKEGDRMWTLSQYLVTALKAYGFTVGSTKSSINDYPKNADGTDAVYKRGQMAKGFDLMLSLHSNACDTASVNRAVIIYPMSGAKQDLAAKLGACVKSTMGVSSYQLMQRDFDTGNQYSGAKSTNKDYYGVIRGSVSVGTPCIIIEHGFHTNTAVAKWLCSDANLKKLAEAEAKVLADYYGMKKKIYRVQVGAFTNRSGAEKTLADLKKAGFSGFIAT